MSWLKSIDPSAATGRLSRLYSEAIARAGKVYGIVRSMSLNPPVLEASIGFYRAVMFAPSPLSRRQREMLAVITSRANKCHY